MANEVPPAAQPQLYLILIPRALARTLGLKRFYTGEPCKQGHIAERYVTNKFCLECSRQSNRGPQAKLYRERWLAKHPGWKQAHYQKNKARENARTNAYHRLHGKRYAESKRLHKLEAKLAREHSSC